MIAYEPQDPTLTAFQQSQWKRLRQEREDREALRTLGLLGVTERMDAAPIRGELTLRDEP